MHIRLGETEQARNALQTIREIAPNASAAIVLLAELDVRTGRYPDAIPALEDLARRQPSVAVVDLLGQAYYGERRYEEATAAFRSFAGAVAGDRRAHFMLGQSLLAEGKVEEARKPLQESLRLDPAYVEPLNMLATLDAQSGRLGQAVDRVQLQMEQIDPTGGHYFSLGMLYLASNQMDHAETALLKAVELQPDMNAAYGQLVGIYVASNRAEEAIVSLERALEHDPDNLSVMMLKASVQHVTNDKGGAQDTYEPKRRTTRTSRIPSAGYSTNVVATKGPWDSSRSPRYHAPIVPRSCITSASHTTASENFKNALKLSTRR